MFLKNEGPFNAYISSVGHFFPERVIDNHYFEEYLETNDDVD